MDIILGIFLLFGLVIAVSVGIAYFFRYFPEALKIVVKKVRGLSILPALGVVVLFAQASVTYAQTPVPNLQIPTTVIFDEANTWIQVFAPIAAIGIGISIAISVLGYVGKMIVGAFR